MSFDLVKIFHEMDWMARGVCVALLLMGIASLTVFIERTVAFWRSTRQSRRVARETAELFERHDYDGLLQAVARYPHSHLASLLGTGLKTYLGAQAKVSQDEAVELVKRELLRKQEDAGLELRR